MRAAFLDACAIVPSLLRDVLFEIAFIGIYRVSWSPGVEIELIRTVSRLRRERGIPIPATIEYSARLLHQMNHAFPVARVEILGDSIGNYGDLPDLGDAHIIEGALRSESDVIVTFNLKDFPSALLHGSAQIPSALEVIGFHARSTSGLLFGRRLQRQSFLPTRPGKASYSRNERNKWRCAVTTSDDQKNAQADLETIVVQEEPDGDREISTQEAADLLNMTRPTVVKLCEEGAIPFRKITTHRRLGIWDVLNYC